MPGYYRIPADNRDLNYSQYEISGHNIEDDMQDFTSHNTNQLSVDEIKQLLLTLDMVKSEL